MTAFSTRVMRPEDWLTLRYFKPEEFRKPHLLGFEFVQWLDEVRHRAGVPMHITSDARSAEHNAEVGGATDSAHMDVPCSAVDIGERPTPEDPHWSYSRYAIIQAAMSLGCVRIGVYADGSLHLDRTEDRRPHPCMWRKARP